ncbi:MAG: HAMP domain-containing sensor histidine kinase [Oscillospiraceae bacterium]
MDEAKADRKQNAAQWDRGEEPKKIHFFRSLQTKFALTYILAIAAVLLLLNTYPVLISEDLVFNSKQISLQNQAAVIGGALAVSENLTVDGVKEAMTVLDDGVLARILVTDPDGKILYDTQESGTSIGTAADADEIQKALDHKDVFRIAYEDGAFRSAAAAPIVYRSKIIGAVYLSEIDVEQAELLSGIQSNLRNISIIICILVLGMSALFSKALAGRIGTLLGAIRIVREGQYSHRVKLSGGDELSQLAGEFNQLTGRLQTTEEVRRRFVSDASHELKTPLASIRLLTDSILQNEKMDDATAREFVGDIGDEADRLNRITEKLLTLTRMDDTAVQPAVPVDVGEVLTKVEHMLKPLAAAVNVSLECHLEENCLIAATEDDLYQIAFNLVENAVKYNLPGGSVLVSLAGTEDAVILRVEDTGVGIPEEDLNKIFDRFYRVDKARSRAAGGTGLGLSIVQDTVKAHGGTVEARRRDPEGTCFVATFPRLKTPQIVSRKDEII